MLYEVITIIGDYRRVALYGTGFLIKEKSSDLENLLDRDMSEETIRLREEVTEQIKSLNELTDMAKGYGFDISVPASNARITSYNVCYTKLLRLSYYYYFLIPT